MKKIFLPALSFIGSISFLYSIAEKKNHKDRKEIKKAIKNSLAPLCLCGFSSQIIDSPRHIAAATICRGGSG